MNRTYRRQTKDQTTTILLLAILGVSCLEVANACFNPDKPQTTKEVANKWFKAFDVNKNGKVTKKEYADQDLRHGWQKDHPGEDIYKDYLDNMWAVYDTNKDGVLSVEEYYQVAGAVCRP